MDFRDFRRRDIRFLTHMESSMQDPLTLTVTQHEDLIWILGWRLPPPNPACLQWLLCLICICKINFIEKRMFVGSRGVSCWPREQGMEKDSQRPGVIFMDWPVEQEDIHGKDFAKYSKLL